MCKTDISKNDLSIKRIINVIKSEINNRPKPWHVDNRHSDAFVYIISGSCSYSFDDKREFTVHEGDILYLAYNSDYKMEVHSNNYQFIFCDFEFDADSERKSEVYSPQNASDAENLFCKLLKYYTYPSKASFAECMSVLYSIYGIILMTAASTYIEKSVKYKISEAKRYIDINFKDVSLSVALLAEKSGMSEVYFRKLFKSQYHTSPSQYIISVRIKNSKKLMKYHFLSIEECALQSGFSSLQYFCRIFKNTTGITPAKYRNEIL